MKYTLYYWRGIQGRGEFVRLALEEAGADYIDTDEGIRELLEAGEVPRPPYAPPFLRAGRLLIAQTANILMYLGPRHGLAPKDAAGRLWVNQLQLTVADFVAEIHDTHHPVGSSLYYEQQKTEAKRRTKEFLSVRLPKYLGYFERVLERSGGPFVLGKSLAYADLSLAQVVAGLKYAFPDATRTQLKRRPNLSRLHEGVFARPRIRRYVMSKRRVPFNNDDLFRRYPELGG